ncbi:exported hypothetical protein [Burkholderiales bacterium]|nr:exported hypothetical protein [Burkholderiales bacterium]
MSNVRSAQQLPRQRSASRRRLRRQWALALLLLLGSGKGLPADGGPAAMAPDWLQLETGLRVSREALDSHWSSVVRRPASRPDYSLANTEPMLPWSSLSKVPVILETSPSHVAASEPQTVYRPQLSLGGASESLRSWLRVAGIDASHCLAPLMKLHSSFAGSSQHANVSVSARCSIH